ncbi:phospholipase D-like domain-containing protein [Actinokineospora bangkokensis]|uniref:Uncharacterized protein n=1 Tax=Actinokineospora bangkokensis TaxID=1193682 RepID=A0A1Q9LII1_9PSEU|nr:hypothetical protein [Actinokineospora bangkokensis]OLR91857.1 hypothetical protein BJP25_23765 [Actinokineospora bangkokensis]
MPGIRVFLPYESVQVRIRLGYGTELSRIETSVLRGIVLLWLSRREPGETERAAVPAERAGIGLSTLVDRFNLGERMTLDLIFDLWRREYVSLDLYRGLVAPTPDIVRIFQAGGERELEGGEYTLETVDLWFDRVSGHLTGRAGYSHPPSRDVVVPGDRLFNATVDKVSGGAVVRAVEELLRERRLDRSSPDEPAKPQGRAQRVLETRIVPAALAPAAVRRAWFPIDITAREDPVSGDLRVTAAEDSFRSAAQYQRIGRLLGQFIQQRPRHAFAAKVRGTAESRLADPPSLDRSIDKLLALTEDAQTAAAGTRTALHQQLEDAIATTRNQIAARVDGEVQVDLVRSCADHREAVRSVIRRAERQLVIVVSSLRYEGVADLLPALQDAVLHGVQLVLLWNRRRAEAADDRVDNAFQELRLRAADHHLNDSNVLVARKPSNVNANFVVADDHTALLGGYSFLGKLDRGADHLAAVISASGSGTCQFAGELLRWARTAAPDAVTAAAVRFRTRDFRPDPPPPASAGLTWLPLPTPLDQDVTAADATARAWALAWRRCTTEVTRVLAGRTLPSATLVEDTGHRDAFWDGLRAATRQVVVSGERLSSKVVNKRLLDLVRERVALGTRVDVFHRYVEKGSDDARLELAAAAEGSSALLRSRRVEATSRALVCDDDAVIGSFDFLAHEGFHSAGPGRRLPAELSVRISGGDVASRVAAELGGVSVAPRRRTVPALDGVSTRGHRLLAELDACTDPAARADLVVDAVGAGSSPATLLSELRVVGASTDVLRLVTAAALRGRLAAVPQDLVQWAHWLIEDLWAERRFVEAWVLRLSQPASPLPEALCFAGAAAGTDWVAEALSTAAVEDDLTPAVAAALIAHATSQVLAWPGGPRSVVRADVAHELREVLRSLEGTEGMARCWRRLARAVVDLPPAVDDPGAAALARVELLKHRRESALAEAWEAAAEAQAAAAQVLFTFEVGIKTHGRLFHPNGLFGHLQDIIDRRDLTAAAEWVQRPEVGNLPAFLDRTSAGVVAIGHKKNTIHSTKRWAYLNRLSAVRDAAQVVAAFATGNSAEGRHQVEVTRPFAVALADLWSHLRADLASHPAPERHLTDHALDSMKDILDWGIRERG